MQSPTAIALTGFIPWALFLLIVMELIRTGLVASGKMSSNQFRPDNANLSPFMQRLARAHANCVEGLPIFGGLMLVALVTSQTSVTDSLAYTLLAARVIQSSVHLTSLKVIAVNMRFFAFTVQMAIAAYWSVQLLARLV
jgi:uncharacterized MAPEG superfamily protein